MKKISNDTNFEKELVSLIKDSSNIVILRINIKWLNNNIYVSIIITSLIGIIHGLIIGLLFNNVENGLIIGLIIGIICGIYIGYKINKDYMKKDRCMIWKKQIRKK